MTFPRSRATSLLLQFLRRQSAAQIAPRERVLRVARHAQEFAVLHGCQHGAGVGTVVGAGGLDSLLLWWFWYHGNSLCALKSGLHTPPQAVSVTQTVLNW